MATESFFSSASLAYLASAGAGKDGKTYSIKPTDGTGDFTFSRGSNLAATRVGADGLIEKGRENLFLYSNKFDESYWQKLNGCSILGQTATDPFGVANNAWVITFDGTTNGRLEKQVSGSQVKTMSIYVRTQSGTQDVQIGFGSAELVTKTITTTWQRIEKFTSNNIYPRLRCDSATTLEVFGFQLELGLAATDYIESGATTGKAGLLEDEPRFDYSGGATCPSLLLEPSRTNLIQYSEYLDGIGWSGKIGVSFDTNTTTSPEGLENSALLKEDSSNGSHFAYKDFALTSGSTYTISIFAKLNGANRNLRFGDGGLGWSSGFNGVFDLTAGTATGGTIEPMGSGWYRCSVTGTTNATSSRLIVYSTLGVATSYQGDGSSGVYLYGFQVEQGSYPTSYIPNHSGGSVTRGVDECENAGDVNTFNSTEGVLYLEASAINDDSSEKGLAINDGGTNNRINIRIVNNDIKAYGIVGGSLVCLMTYTAPSVTSINKIAFKYKENDFALWVNGVERVTDTSGSIFPANTLNELSFDYGGASAFFNGNVKQVLVFKEALSDADLTTLTT